MNENPKPFKAANCAVTVAESFTKVEYYGTRIAIWDDNRITLSNGGYQTASTKKRLNQVSDHFGLCFGVYSDKGVWFVQYCGQRFDFIDNREVTFSRIADAQNHARF